MGNLDLSEKSTACTTLTISVTFMSDFVGDAGRSEFRALLGNLQPIQHS